MKALSVHGGGAELERTSGRVGLGGYDGVSCCMHSSARTTLEGREDLTSSIDVASSSASQSETTMDERGEVSGGGVERYDDCTVSGFRRIMARFQSRILDPVLSIDEAFLFCERLRPGL